MVLKKLQLISKKYKNFKRNVQKQLKKKQLTTFFISIEEEQLKRNKSY